MQTNSFWKTLFIYSILPLATLAQEPTPSIWNSFLEKTYYSKPFVSEIHSTLNKVEMGYNKSYSEFDLLEQKSRFNRPIVELHLGFEAPLFAYGYGTHGSKSNWGIGMTLPLSVHVLEDILGPVTAPVINTDYRFGSPKIIGIRTFENNKFLKNISFSWLPIFHECTHLGDEITIYRIKEAFPITRINISYEYTEFQLTINDPEKIKTNCHSLRLGFMYRISDRGLGWYSIVKGLDVTEDINLSESKYRSEYYAQYQFQRTQGFMASQRFMNIISLEMRNRIRYGYPLYYKDGDVWQTKDVKESMELNMNLYAGYKFFPKESFNHAMGLFFHAYRGLNPYGQLRNYPSYPFFGLAITYEP